jgi:hypothetical protein
MTTVSELISPFDAERVSLLPNRVYGFGVYGFGKALIP